MFWIKHNWNFRATARGVIIHVAHEMRQYKILGSREWDETIFLNNDEESGVAPDVYTPASQSLLGVQVSNQNPTLHFIASLVS